MKLTTKKYVNFVQKDFSQKKNQFIKPKFRARGGKPKKFLEFLETLNPQKY